MTLIVGLGIIGYLIYTAFKERQVVEEKEKQKSLNRYNSRLLKHKEESTPRQETSILVSLINRFVSLVEDPKANYYAKHDVFKRMEKRQNDLETFDELNDEAYFGRVEDEEEFVTMSPEVDDGEVYTTSQWESMSAQQITVQDKKTMKRAPLQKAYILSEVFNKPKGLE